MMKRCALAIVFMLVASRSSKLYAQCSNCAPTLKSGHTLGSPMTVYLDPNLSTLEANAAYNAVAEWNQWFIQQGLPAPYSFTASNCLGDVNIMPGAYLHNSGYGAETINGSSIYLNPDYQNRSDNFMPDVLAHEFGHAIGFADVGSGADTHCVGQSIMYYGISLGGPYNVGPTATDKCQMSLYCPPSGGSGDGETLSQCAADGSGCGEPIIFNLGSGGYQLTGLEDPVAFDIFAIGPRGGTPSMGWTARGSSLAFLALDRNGNGRIDNGGELFGTGTLLKGGAHAASGFEALARYDANNDGYVDADDPVWAFLLLWIDSNHDGVSQASELQPISRSGITRIGLAHRWTHRRDSSGNYFGYQGTFFESNQPHLFYDIFFALSY